MIFLDKSMLITSLIGHDKDDIIIHAHNDLTGQTKHDDWNKETQFSKCNIIDKPMMTSFDRPIMVSFDKPKWPH